MRNIKALVIASVLALPFTAFATPDQKPAPSPTTPAPAQPAPTTPPSATMPGTKAAAPKVAHHKLTKKAPKKTSTHAGS